MARRWQRIDRDTAEVKLQYAPSLSQRRFHRADAKYRGFSGPVGSGKSLALAYEAIKLGYVNGGLMGLIGAPTYRMLRDATLPLLIEALEENTLPYTLNKSSMQLTLEDVGSPILLRSLDDPEHLRGSNLAWFGVDELTYCTHDAWIPLQARMREAKATDLRGFAVWTPRGFDWVYRDFIGPKKKSQNEAAIAVPGENVGVGVAADYYAGLRESYSEKFYRQEVLGEYLDMFSGRVYFAFDQTHNVTDLSYVSRQPLFLACDFNITPMAWVIGQRVTTETGVEKIHVLKEVVLRDASIDDAAQFAIDRLRELIPDWEGNVNLEIYGDPAGNARVRSAAIGAARSDWEAVKRNLRRVPWLKPSYRVANAHPPVKDRVEAVNRLCCDATSDGVSRRLFVDHSCEGLIEDLNRVSWKSDSHGNMAAVLNKSNPDLTHLSDALGYAVHRLYGAGRSQVSSMVGSAW